MPPRCPPDRPWTCASRVGAHTTCLETTFLRVSVLPSVHTRPVLLKQAGRGAPMCIQISWDVLPDANVFLAVFHEAMVGSPVDSTRRSVALRLRQAAAARTEGAENHRQLHVTAGGARRAQTHASCEVQGRLHRVHARTLRVCPACRTHWAHPVSWLVHAFCPVRHPSIHATRLSMPLVRLRAVAAARSASRFKL